VHEDVRLSRLRISRRRALGLGGTVGLAGVLAACGAAGSTASAAAGTTHAAAPSGASAAAAGADLVALLDRANTCTMAKEETQGPYWFDVDSIRTDIREDRPGTELALAIRVLDLSQCTADSKGTPVANSVVEIWHCDAGGVYSGFESQSTGGGGAPGGAPPGPPPNGGGAPQASGGESSSGSYSVGDQEATTSDDGTYLRGAQVADASGIAQFTTIVPGWYRGRTPHVHVKVHVDKKTVLTTQLFFDDALVTQLYAAAPYSSHTGQDTTNANDSIYDAAGLLTMQQQGSAWLGVINLGVDL
jgi:protocatechuate 3,4-dioxygenase beta subunit